MCGEIMGTFAYCYKTGDALHDNELRAFREGLSVYFRPVWLDRGSHLLTVCAVNINRMNDDDERRDNDVEFGTVAGNPY